MGAKNRGIAHQVFRARGMGFPLLKFGVSSPQKCLLMRSPIFFSKGRSVRFWIQILLVLALVRIAIVPSALYANPTGEQVVGGAATFNRPDAATLIVKQQTDRAVINWNSFSIANGELTKFVQPSSSSAVLNRVVTANPSQIYGTLQGNGQVLLINPGGTLVGAGGQVNAASFMASTRDIGTEEFMRGGTMNFTGNSDASVVNKGKIEASTGDVLLVAQEVKNEGQIMAKDGTVGLVSGTSVTLETVGPGPHYKVRLLDVENSSGSRGSSKTSAEIVNEGVIEAANAELLATGNYLSLAIKNTGTVRATGLVQNADGSVTLTGGQGDILNTGVLAALQKSVDGVEQGGMIDISGKNIRADEGSLITASGQDVGGKIKFESKDTTMLGGRVEATGYSSKSQGGRVEALGTRVGLRSGEINVDGGAKGGTVLVGGDYLGVNPDIPNADAVVMLPDAKISANARENGDGGKVILWSEDYTGFFGRISAMGGVEGGNGGFIETSSRNNLQAFGEAQASAPKGISGEWLLDPYNVTVADIGPTQGGSFGGGNPDIFTPIQDSATILNTEINRALDSGTSVTITTGSAYVGSQIGNITINAEILKSKDTPPDGPPVTLSLLALNDITINADIRSTAGPLYMVMVADVDNNQGGNFTLGAGTNLLTNGGDISITAVNVSLDNGTLNTIQTQQLPVTVTSGGSYAPGVIPEVSFTVPVTNGEVAPGATALMGLRNINVISGGTGYQTAPAVTITGGGGQSASASAVMRVKPGVITPQSGGVGYATAPTVQLVGGGGSGATATATVQGGIVTSITITDGGRGYTSLPSVILTGGGGTGAFARVTSLEIARVDIAQTGTGFTSAPTISFQGGGATTSGAAVANLMQVVNLDYSTYGVGYSLPPTVAFSGAGGAAATLGLTTIAGSVALLPSVSLNAVVSKPTIGIGSGAGTFQVSGVEIANIYTTGSALSGAITIGSRSAGDATLGQATPVTLAQLGGKNLTIVSGGTIQDDGLGVAPLAPALSGDGLITLNAADGIGTTSNPVNIGGARINLITEGPTLNLSTLNDVTGLNTTLTQLGIQTDGTVSSISVVDGNLSLNVFENRNGNGNTFFNGMSVATGSIDFTYENTSGDIQIGIQNTPSFRPGISILQNVQDATLGVPTVLRDLELRAPNGTILVYGPIFSGGGNITLASQDITTGAEGLGWNLLDGELTNDLQDNESYYGRGVINTFQSDGTDFGVRSPLLGANDGSAGSVQGLGGVLTLEPTSNRAEGRRTVLSLEGGTVDAYSLSWGDTTMLEAPQIRIGGSKTGEILLEDLNSNTFRLLTFTYGSPPTNENISYIPRYFENPFFSADTTDNGIAPNPKNTEGIPHVTGGVVSFVSALGKTRNVSGGDVNLYGLEMTGVDGVYFDGRGGSDNYAAIDQYTANNSIVRIFNGRVGRTVEDQTIGNGGSLTAYIPFGFRVEDGVDNGSIIDGTRVLTEQANAATQVAGGQVTGIASDSVLSNIQVTSTSVYTAGQIADNGTPSVVISSTVGTGATASSYLALNSLVISGANNNFTVVPGVIITGGGGTGALATVAASVASAPVTSGGSGYVAPPAVTISAPPLGGTQATATATVLAGAVTLITITNPGSGYTTTPTIAIDDSPTGATATASLLFSVDSLTLTSGGDLYTSVPTVSFTSEGNATAAVDTLVVSGARVTNSGTGYSTAPTITIAPPTGGVSPTALAAITSGGGKSYTSAPPVALYGGGIQLASARAIQSDDGVIQFIAPQITGLGYTSAPEVSIIDPSGKGTGATATAFVNGLGQLTPFNMLNLGEGYEAPPTVTISGPTGSGAVARAEVSGYVQKLGVNGVGSGYSSTPTVSITGGNGTGAQAVAFRNANSQISPFEVVGAPTYLSLPTITITGDGQGATATPILSNGTSGTLIGIQVVNPGGLYTTVTDVLVNGVSGIARLATSYSLTDFGGTITPIYIKNPGMGYTSTPSVALLGGGINPSSPTASATTAQGVTALYITDPGQGYSGDPSQFKIKISGGGGTGAEAVLDGRYTFVDLNKGLTPIAITSRGVGYTLGDEPMISLSGGGIAQAQARAILDKNLGSSTFGQVTAYEITDPGLGYTSNPSVEVGWGQAFGNFGEYGISTETVDRNVGSGSISLSNLGGARIGGMTINAPIRTGDSQGVPGGNAISGSILLDAGPGLTFNTDGGTDGILITGDASIVPHSTGVEYSRSGSVTLGSGSTILNSVDSSLVALSGSRGIPIQIGTASGASENRAGALNASVTINDSLTVFTGDVGIYAVAPGQVEAAQGGRPLDPNHKQPAPRTSNDLKLTGLFVPNTVTDDSGATFPNEATVIVEVGGLGGKLDLLRRPESEALATVRNGSVTLITPDQSGIFYIITPDVIVSGGGIVPAEVSAFIEGGSLVGENPNRPNELTVDNPGLGYYITPEVVITDPTGKGAGATAVAVIGSDPADPLTYGRVIRVNITNPGYGYTVRPTVEIGGPQGIQATATATVVAQTIPVTTLTVQNGGITNPGVGYLTPPLVTITGGRYGTATATATVDTTPGSATYAQIKEITITLNGDTFVSGTAGITIGGPARQAQADAILSNGQVSSFEITNTGGGYTGTPDVLLVTNNGDPYNIGTSGKLGLFADRLQIFDAATPASLLITAGVAAVAPFTNQFPVDVGSEVAGRTSLVVRELQRFNSDTLVVGRRDSEYPIVGAGVINLSEAISADDLSLSGGLVLAGTRELFSTGISGADFENVVVDVGGTVLMTGSGNASHYFSGIIRDSGLAHGEANITATAQAVVSAGQLSSITTIFGGTGYYERPIVTIGAPSSSGTQATAVATIQNGVVTGYRITNSGSGYDLNNPPAVTISEASPASFNLSSKLRTTGTGNTVVPLTIGEVFINSAEFTGQRFYQGITTQDGDIRIAANELQQTRVVGFLDTTGAGAFPVSSSSVFLTPYESGVTAQVLAQPINGSIQAGSFTIEYGGAGYLAAPDVYIDDPTGSGAFADAILDSTGKVSGFTITSSGSNYSNPTVRLASPSATRPVEIIYNQSTPLTQLPFTTAQVVKSGDGYTFVPKVEITGGGGSAAKAMAVMSLGTVAVPVNAQGSGYTSAPTVTITGGGGVGGGAEAIVDYLTGKVVGIRVIDAGYGYTSQPEVTISGGGGSGATATAFLAVQSLTLSTGSGYSTSPTITIQAPNAPDISKFPNLASGTATGLALGGSLSLRIGNASAPALELVKAASVVIGSSSASSITLNTDFAYNYGAYPMAPRTLVLETAGNVALGISQISPSPSPIPKTSSIQIPNLSIISGGTVSLGAVAGAAAPIHTVRGFSASVGTGGLTFNTTATPLVISDFSPEGGAMGIFGNGTVSLTAPDIQVPVMPVSPSGLYSTIRTLGDINLTANGLLTNPGVISVAVIPQFNNSAYTSSTMRTAANITLTADRIQIGYNGVNVDPGVLSTPILSADGRVILQPETPGSIITIADSTALPNPKTGFGFIPTELANIGASILQIGNASAGAISIQAPVTLYQTYPPVSSTPTPRLTTALSLISGSEIGDNGGDSGINYGGGLRLSSVGSISFTGSGNDFGTVAANSGGNYPITLSSEAFSIGEVVDTVNGINAGSSRVTLQPHVTVPPTLINLGTKSGWSFTDSELDLVTASILQIGRSSAGQITVSAAMTLPSTVPILDLETGAGVADQGAGSTTGIDVNSLVIRAGSAPVSLLGSGNDVSNLAGVISGAGQGFFFTDNSASASDPLTITTVDGQIGITTNNGDITLTAGDMNVLQAITAGNGTITLQPLNAVTPISLNNNSSGLSLSALELQRLSTSGTVVIGQQNGTGTISLGGLGTIDLSSNSYSLLFRGAASNLNFYGGLILATGKTFTLDLWNGVSTTGGDVRLSDSFAGTAVTISNGTLSILSAGSIGLSPDYPLTASVSFLSGDSTKPGVRGLLNLRNNQSLSVVGPVKAGGNVYLSSSTGQLSNSVAGTIESTGGSVTLEGDTMALGGNVTGTTGINLQPYTPSASIGVFDGATGTLQISNVEFGLLQGTTPVTIGRSNGSGNVIVAGYTLSPARNLTIQAPSQAFGGTFQVTGPLVNNGGNLSLNAGGGALTTASTIGLGTGAAYLTAQSITLGDILTANGGVIFANGNSLGNVYLNAVGSRPTMDLDISELTLARINSTGFVGFGSTTSDTSVIVGQVVVGSAAFNFGGLALLAGANGSVRLTQDLNSNGKSIYIDGPLVLDPSDTIINMTNGGAVPAGASLSILAGIWGATGTENLSVTLGTGLNVLTLAGDLQPPNLSDGTATDRIGALSLNLGAGSVTLGTDGTATPTNLQPGPIRGLNLGVTQPLILPGTVSLRSPNDIRLTGYSGASLTVGNVVETSGATAPFFLTTLGGGDITTGSVSVSNLTVNGSDNVTLGGAVNTTGFTSVTGGAAGTVITQAAASAGTDVTLQGGSLQINGGITTGRDITLLGDSLDFGASVEAVAGRNATVGGFTSTRGFTVGVGRDLSPSDLLRIQTTSRQGEVRIGNPIGTGGVVLRGPVDLSTSDTFNYAIQGISGGLNFQGSSPVLSLRSGGKLRLDLGTGSVTSSGGTDLSISEGELIINTADQVTIRTAVSTVRQSPGGKIAGLNLINAASLTLDGALNTGAGNISIRTLSGNLTLGSQLANGKIRGGIIQLGAAQNFINQAGSQPFINAQGGRTLIYSLGQRFDTPYNFAGLEGFGAAFGRGFGSMPGSGNYLVYSSYADVGLANGWQYGSFFAGNSVSALMPYGLFRDVDRLYMPNARSFNLEYILYPDRLEPETLTIPKSVLGSLEDTLGRPPTLQEIQQREVAIREAAMAKKGAIMERSSFDSVIEEKDEEERAEGEKVENSDGGVPQAKIERTQPITDEAKPVARLPVSAPQAGKSPTRKQGSNGPILRAGPIRSVALLRPAAPSEGSQSGIFSKQAPLLDAKSVIEQERASAEVGIAPPIAAGR